MIAKLRFMKLLSFRMKRSEKYLKLNLKKKLKLQPPENYERDLGELTHLPCSLWINLNSILHKPARYRRKQLVYIFYQCV